MGGTNETMLAGEPDISFTVGVSYIVTAVIFIPLHIVCSYLMYTDKDMKNPTYRFMINLSIADIFELVTVGLYAGSVLVTKVQPDVLERWISLLGIVCWYVNCVLFVLIAFSRWITITRPHMTQRIFSQDVMRSLHIAPWVIFALLYFHGCVFLKSVVFIPFLFTWTFDTSTAYGRYLHWNNTAFNSLCAVVEFSFNILSLRRVHTMRNSIQSFATTENQRREVKLLLQCFILGLVFILTEILFTTVITMGVVTPALLLGMQFTWTSNHCINPVVYLCVNTKLRQRFLSLITCGKWATRKEQNSVIMMSIF